MAAGTIVTVSSLNSQLGGMASNLDGTMHQFNAGRIWVIGAGGGTTGLIALGYSSGDASNIFNTLADIGNELWSIYTGTATQASFRGGAYDYRTNLSLLGGTLIH